MAKDTKPVVNADTAPAIAPAPPNTDAATASPEELIGATTLLTDDLAAPRVATIGASTMPPGVNPVAILAAKVSETLGEHEGKSVTVIAGHLKIAQRETLEEVDAARDAQAVAEVAPDVAAPDAV